MLADSFHLLTKVFNPLSILNDPTFQKNRPKAETRSLREVKEIHFELKMLALPLAFDRKLVAFLNKFCEKYLLDLFGEYKRFLENSCDVIFSTVDDENLRLVKKEIITVDIKTFVPSASVNNLFVKGGVLTRNATRL